MRQDGRARPSSLRLLFDELVVPVKLVVLLEVQSLEEVDEARLEHLVVGLFGELGGGRRRC